MKFLFYFNDIFFIAIHLRSENLIRTFAVIISFRDVNIRIWHILYTFFLSKSVYVTFLRK